MNYYNEIDPYAAQWLRNLISKRLLPPGLVDDRSIAVVSADDLRDFRQCHFFAGIGGWSLAARLAGWPDERELWTGSPPCQPFSIIGKGGGQNDERHLWPDYFRLIAACRPVVAMGEQVSAAVGRNWFDGVLFDLESIGYAGRAVVVPACAVNAPHRRDRIWFVAERGPMGNGKRAGLEGLARNEDHAPGRAFADRPTPATSSGGGAWDGADWITGHDGKARRVKPGVCLLANGVSGRVGRLRAYGNAIVPQVAAEVIGAYLDARP